MSIGRNRIVLIAGAGLAGSLLAVMLARRGFRVEVLERRPDLRKTAGSAGRSINLALSTRGIRALAEVGLDSKVLATTLPMAGRRMHALDGTLSAQPYGLPGQAIRSVSRRLLNEALLDAAEAEAGVRLRFGVRVESVDLDATTATIRIDDGGAGEAETLHADLIVGCDGIGSAVRDAMAARAAAGGATFEFEQLTLDHGYKELELPPTASGDFALDPTGLHIWPRRDYMLIALPNADRTFTATLFAQHDGPDSFADAGEGAQARAYFEARFADALPLIPDFEAQWARNPTSSLATIACFPFHHGASVALVGDAAHAVVPFYGQGMNAAFESASIFCQLLDRHGGDLAAALPAFSAERKDDADAIRQLALDNFVEMRANVADVRFLQRRRLGRLIEARAGEAFRSLYSMVTFSNIPYATAHRLGQARERWLDQALGGLRDDEGAQITSATGHDVAWNALADALADAVARGDVPAEIRQPAEAEET